jgi:Lon-like ATP-dependent protease
VTRDYLDSITQIPWGKTSVENNNIKRAREILEEDHYGLKDVKDHILEFIAMNKLRNSAHGKILCLCGPPGVGKTSIGKSMARALDRPFFRFSVGGLTDVAEIKGHRKTYIGAMPGKIVNALKKVQTENPLILIDEIDKIGTTENSAPASALLELLDPEQNDHFLDHYIDIPIDLSKVLFVCTANTLDRIPVPLLDRMEIVRLSGYTFEEKENIALRHLVPTCKVNAGLCHADVALTHDAVHKIINGYCHEDGVRGLKNNIDKVFRKVAFQMVQEQESHSHFQIRSDQQQDKTFLDDVSSSLELNANHLKNYLGPEKYHSHKLYEKDTPPGTIMALARTEAGKFWGEFLKCILLDFNNSSLLVI